ncbi:MAG: hypothetical protein M1836_005816 [Candelina mexicana]|nr:MAG: hypothetical protein M1836_005816 [Candelina mexicana]
MTLLKSSPLGQLRKIGIRQNHSFHKADSDLCEPSSVGLGLKVPLASESSFTPRTRPHSSLGYPAAAPSLIADLSLHHDGQKTLLRSPSNSDSTFSSFDNEVQPRSYDPDPLGLHLVLDHPHAAGDIIFVHGLGGSSKKTWSWKRDVHNFWPEWLQQEDGFPAHRIFTYGYNSNFKGVGTNLNITDFAKDLLFQMLVYSTESEVDCVPIGTLPIILVAHSMGGLVMKKAYVLGKHDEQYAHIIPMIRAMMFFATPHKGAHYAKILNNILSTSLLGASPKAYVGDLDTQSRALQDINEQFRTSCADLRLFSFYETFATSLWIKSALIVEKESATLGYPQELSNHLNADHHTICKFENSRDGNYISVQRMLRLWASELFQSSDLAKAGETHLRNEGEPLTHVRRRSSTSGLAKNIEAVMGVRERAEDDFDALRAKTKTGTCQWLTQRPDFQQWSEATEHTQSPIIFWLIGLPATGKTILASYVIHSLMSYGFNKTTQYHFFRASHQNKRTAAYCLRSIASQLAFCNDEFRAKLLDMHEETGLSFSSRDQNFTAIWEKVFEGIIFKMRLKPLYWVLDALDEVDIPTSFINSLVKIRSLTPIKIFITSRPTRIPSGPAACGTQIFTSFLSQDDTRGDIRVYVHDAVSEALPDDEQQMRDDIMDQVLSKAKGSFLWVKLALKSLRDNWHTQEDICKTLTEVPEGMENLYVQMLEKVESQSPRLQAMAKRILTWTACSWRPLTIAELQTAMEPEFTGFVRLQETITQICGNFISVDNNKVSLVHLTARQFLLNSREGAPAFVAPEHGHEHIACVCLKYLCNEKWKRIFKSIGNSTSLVKNASPGQNRLLLAEDGNPLLSYSVCYYAFHVSKAPLDSEKLQEALTDFFARYCLSWIEAIALSGNMRYLTRSAKFLKAYAKRMSRRPVINRLDSLSLKDSGSDDSRIMRLWATDFIRIVGKFGPNLIQSPSSIHRLVPPFCPRSSMIGSMYSLYGPQARSISVTGLSSEGWDDCLASTGLGEEGAASQILATDAFFLTLVSSGGTVVVWHTETCEEVRKLRHGEYVSVMELGRSHSLLATAGSETYRVWDIASGRQLHQIEKPSRALIMMIAFGSAESELIVGLDDCTVICLDLETTKQKWQFTSPISGQHRGCPLIMTMSPDKSKLALSWRGKLPVVWDMYATASQQPFRCRGRDRMDALLSTLAMQWLPDSNSILILCHNTKLIQWHIYDEELREFDHVKPHEMAISLDGNLLLSNDHMGTISVHTFPRLSLIYQLANENEFIEKLAFSPDAQRFYDLRGAVCNVWEPDALVRPDESEFEDYGSSVATEPVIARDESSQSHITALACGFADNFYCAGREDGTVCIHSALDGRKVRKVCSHPSHSSVIRLAWSDSGKFLISADDAGRIIGKRVNLKAENVFAVFPVLDIRVDEPPQQFIFNKDENLLLISTPSLDRVWDLNSRQEIYSRAWNVDRGWRWVQHPSQSDLLIWIDPFMVYTFTWKDLEHADPPEYSASEQYPSMPTSSHGNDVLFAATTNNKQYVVYLSGTGKSETRLSSGVHMEILKISTLEDQHPHSLVSKCMTEVASQIKYLIGIYQDLVVFLDHDYWLCTWDIVAELQDVTRHFFLPKDWLNHSTLPMAILNDQGTLFCPKHGEVAIVRNGIRL